MAKPHWLGLPVMANTLWVAAGIDQDARIFARNLFGSAQTREVAQLDVTAFADYITDS
jgi:hypothetical protein